MTQKKGIAVAGNMIVDVLKKIKHYPHCGNLTKIESLDRAIGGGACNVGVDLARLDPSVFIKSIGVVGNDSNGEFIINQLSQYKNIDVSSIKKQQETSFTDVMTDQQTKLRTFFHYAGANALVNPNNFDYDSLKNEVSMIYIGYIMLLSAMDAKDEIYGTAMARVLSECKKRGIETIIDCVSEDSPEFSKTVTPALKYADYCIINEVEAGFITNLSLRDEKNNLIEEKITLALQKIKSMGVSTWTIIHCPEAAYGIENLSDKIEKRNSLKLPEGYIKGTVGAGDAFCAGVIYGAYSKKSMKESIDIGIACAAASLGEYDSSSGIVSFAQTQELFEKYRLN